MKKGCISVQSFFFLFLLPGHPDSLTGNHKSVWGTASAGGWFGLFGWSDFRIAHSLFGVKRKDKDSIPFLNGGRVNKHNFRYFWSKRDAILFLTRAGSSQGGEIRGTGVFFGKIVYNGIKYELRTFPSFHRRGPALAGGWFGRSDFRIAHFP